MPVDSKLEPAGEGDGKRRDVRTLVSPDGTRISVSTVGQGPSVIVVHGVLSRAHDLDFFADALADRYTVHTVERRGRGLSGAQGGDYGMLKECQDIDAVQSATGANLIFGHSYGGLIALEAARLNAAFSKVAVYEPGVSVGGSIALGWIDAYKKMLTANKPLDAFAIFSVGAGPRRARRVPVWLMKFLLPCFIGAAERSQTYQLLSTNLTEHVSIGRLDDTYPRYREMSAAVLVMRGNKSDLDWVEAAVAALVSVIPSVTVRVFSKLDHFGPAKTGPVEVASAVSAFFSSGAPVLASRSQHPVSSAKGSSGRGATIDGRSSYREDCGAE